jgi:hypothetical protein
MRHAYHEDDEPCGIHISQSTMNWKEKKRQLKGHYMYKNGVV